MKTQKLILIIICSVSLPSLALGGFSKYSVGSGTVTGVLPGIVYINGNSGKIYLVGRTSKDSHIYVQTLGSSDLNIGELVEFKGKVIKFLSLKIIDTTEGYLYRPDWFKIQEQEAKKVAEMMEKEKVERERKIAELIAKDVNPQVIPTMMIETTVQKEEKKRKEEEQKSQRRFNIVVSLMTIVIGLLSFDKIPPIIRWIHSLSKVFTNKLRQLASGTYSLIKAFTDKLRRSDEEIQ